MNDHDLSYQDGFCVRVPHWALSPGWVRVALCPSCGSPIWAWNTGEKTSDISTTEPVKLPEHKRTCGPRCQFGSQSAR